jgi:alpha-mannosidase
MTSTKLSFRLIFLLLFHSAVASSQASDTLAVFLSKEFGEDIRYFSPLRQFADQAILTRANGKMPIYWNSSPYHGKDSYVTYEFLIGHSTGTSSDVRYFDLSLNGETLFTLITTPKQTDFSGWSGANLVGCEYRFVPLEYDVNGDVFGKLYITVPSEIVRTKARFGLSGLDEQSRDWMMVFKYSRNLKIEVEPTNLILRKDDTRQMNVYIDYP